MGMQIRCTSTRRHIVPSLGDAIEECMRLGRCGVFLALKVGAGSVSSLGTSSVLCSSRCSSRSAFMKKFRCLRIVIVSPCRRYCAQSVHAAAVWLSR